MGDHSDIDSSQTRPNAETADGLRREIRAAFDQLAAGFGVPADEVYARAEQRIREVEDADRAG